eukprot:GGOE01047555.1.p1 GENE.GGOE01047555.1~~GGOE01047555.1.p1  ORF type:complete len:695 (-),score=164.52 GGOE01047555.1:1055-3139(-)
MRVNRINIVVGTTVVAIMAVIISVWLFLLLSANHQKEQLIISDTTKEASLWRAAFEYDLSSTTSAATSLAGFITGGAQSLPSVNPLIDTPISSDRFETFAQELRQQHPGISSLQILPRAIVTQAYPLGSAVLGTTLQWNSSAESFLTTTTVIHGPFASGDNSLAIFAHHSVFLHLPRTMDTWWGVAGCLIQLDPFVNATGIHSVVEKGYTFRLEFQDADTGTVTVIAASAPELHPTDAVQTIVRLSDVINMTLYLAPVSGWHFPLLATDIALVVGVAVIAGVAMLLGSFLLLRYQHQEQRDNSTAPRQPPVCLIFTDVERSTDLWNANPRAMGAALTVHNTLIRKLIKTYGAYEVKTIGDSFMIACKAPCTALALITNIMQALQRTNAWPLELEKHYGVRWLKIRAGVHLCTDVECSFDTVSKGFDYYGNDVNKAARIAAKACGGDVFLSAEMAQAANDLGDYDVRPNGMHELRGIDQPQEIFQLIVLPPTPAPPRPRRRSMRLGLVPVLTVVPQVAVEAGGDHPNTATGLVREMVNVHDAPQDEAQLVQWVLLGRRLLELAMNPLSLSRQKQLLKELCSGWGLSPQAHTLEHLSLRLAQILLSRYPSLFQGTACSPKRKPVLSGPCPESLSDDANHLTRRLSALRRDVTDVTSFNNTQEIETNPSALPPSTVEGSELGFLPISRTKSPFRHFS